MFSAAWFIVKFLFVDFQFSLRRIVSTAPICRCALRSNRNAIARTYAITRIFVPWTCINVTARSPAMSLQRHIETAQPAQDVGALVGQRDVGIFQPKMRESLEGSANRDRSFHPRQRCANTEMDSVAECHMLVRCARNVELLRLLEL